MFLSKKGISGFPQAQDSTKIFKNSDYCYFDFDKTVTQIVLYYLIGLSSRI